jgi:hypothetical protein
MVGAPHGLIDLLRPLQKRYIKKAEGDTNESLEIGLTKRTMSTPELAESADIDAIEASIRAFIHYEPRCLSLYCDRIRRLEAYANVKIDDKNRSRELTKIIWPTLDHVFRAASEETQRDSFDSERSYSIPMLSIAYLIGDDPKQARILLDCCTGRPAVTEEARFLAAAGGTRDDGYILPTDMPEDSPYWWGFRNYGMLSKIVSKVRSFGGFNTTESLFNQKHDAFSFCSPDVEWDAREHTFNSMQSMIAKAQPVSIGGKKNNSKRIVKLFQDAKKGDEKRSGKRDKKRSEARKKNSRITMEVCHIPNLLTADIFMVLSKTSLDLQDGLELFKHRVVEGCIDYVWWNQTGTILKSLNVFFMDRKAIVALKRPDLFEFFGKIVRPMRAKRKKE